MYFLALSQAPPVLAAEIAICTPLTIAPGKKPAKTTGPKMKPRAKGEKMTFITKKLQEFQVQSFPSRKIL